MERYERLIQIYENMDTVFGMLILIGVWAATFAHILDAGLHGRFRTAILIAFWVLISGLSISVIVLVGLLNIGVLHA
jgi:hypothetical protein